MNAQLSLMTIILLVCAGACVGIIVAVRRLVEVSKPNQWLLLIRNGRLVAGAGKMVKRLKN